jgi:hypothetical protein
MARKDKDYTYVELFKIISKMTWNLSHPQFWNWRDLDTITFLSNFVTVKFFVYPANMM